MFKSYNLAIHNCHANYPPIIKVMYVAKNNKGSYDIELELMGIRYSGPSKCRIMIEDHRNPGFKDFTFCTYNEGQSKRKCLRTCSTGTKKLLLKRTFRKTKYIYIKDGRSLADVSQESHKQGGFVFGFPARKLYNFM